MKIQVSLETDLLPEPIKVVSSTNMTLELIQKTNIAIGYVKYDVVQATKQAYDRLVATVLAKFPTKLNIIVPIKVQISDLITSLSYSTVINTKLEFFHPIVQRYYYNQLYDAVESLGRNMISELLLCLEDETSGNLLKQHKDLQKMIELGIYKPTYTTADSIFRELE